MRNVLKLGSYPISHTLSARSCFLFFALLIFSVHRSNSASAAGRYRYIDGGGTIHWVDTIKEVPPRYRKQLFRTPANYYYGPQAGKKASEYIKTYQVRRNQMSRGGMMRVWRPRGGSWSGL